MMIKTYIIRQFNYTFNNIDKNFCLSNFLNNTFYHSKLLIQELVFLLLIAKYSIKFLNIYKQNLKSFSWKDKYLYIKRLHFSVFYKCYIYVCNKILIQKCLMSIDFKLVGNGVIKLKQWVAILLSIN